MSAVASSIVEKTIKEAIIEHVFGVYQSGGNSDTKPEKGLMCLAGSSKSQDTKKSERNREDSSEFGKSVIDNKRQKTKSTRTSNEMSGSSLGIQGEEVASPKSRRPLQHSVW